MHHGHTRREAIKAGGAAALAAAAFAALVPGGAAALARQAAAPPAKRRAVRLAHLTDSHIQPERGALDGVAACLRHMMALPDRPQRVITGGDLIMDGFAATRERTRLQWDIYTTVMRDGCPLPVDHCLGNHDIWGWNKAKSGSTGGEPEWGKRWACDTLGLSAPYRAVDLPGNWRAIILDSVHTDGGDGYIGRLDEPQHEWLDQELRREPGKHHLVVSHIPIFSMGAVEHDSKIENDQWTIAGGVMHVDAKRLMTVFRERKNVRACISGHIHKVDRTDYEGVAFICGGAVSGAWWKGREDRCDEGYGVVDLFEDGTVGYDYLTYGWKARPA